MSDNISDTSQGDDTSSQQSYTDKAHAAVNHSAQVVNEKTEAWARRANDFIDQADTSINQGESCAGDIFSAAQAWLDKANLYIREKPAQSLCIAAAAGWLIARLTTKR